MLSAGLLELVQLSFRFGPELPGNQAKRQIVHYRALVIKKEEACLVLLEKAFHNKNNSHFSESYYVSSILPGAYTL